MGSKKMITSTHKRKRSWWAFVLILLVAAAGGGAGWFFLAGPGSASAKSTAKAGPDYNTTTIRQGSITLSASGTGTYIPSSSIDLSFSTRGTVAQLNVKAGDSVKAGQELARLGNTAALEAALASAQVQVLQTQKALDDLQKNAQVSLAQAYQNLLKAQNTYDTAGTVQQQSTGARCSSTTIAKLTDTYNQFAATLTGLSISNTGTAKWQLAKGNADTAQANLNYCLGYTAQEKANAQSALQVDQAALQQAKDTYNTLKSAAGVDPNAAALAEANLTQAQTAVTQAKQNLTGVTLIAPIDGTVVFVAAQQGAIVDTSKFITIADLSKPTLNVSIDQTDLSKLVVGSKTQVVFDALPTQTFTGKVTALNPQLTTSGQYQVATGTVELDQAAAKALAGMPTGLNASVTIIDKQASNVLVIPSAALRDLGSGNYAVFLVKNGKLALTPVKVGLMDTAQAEISGDVKAGDVISTGILKSAGN